MTSIRASSYLRFPRIALLSQTPLGPLSGSRLRPLPPAVRSRSLLHKPTVRRFPSPFHCSTRDSMYGTDGHETRRLGAESRPDKPTGLTCERRRHEARPRGRVFFFFSIVRRPPRIARVFSAPVRRGSAVSLSRTWTDRLRGLGGPRGGQAVEFRRRGIPISVLGEISTFRTGLRRRAAAAVSQRERRDIPSACTVAGNNALLACTLETLQLPLMA